MEFYHILLLSFLLLCCYTQGQCLTVRVSVGGDAVLPCDAGTDATDLAVEWKREPVQPDDPYVFFRRNGGEVPDGQHPSYKGRTSLFQNELEKGNVALQLSRVKSSDAGNYTCHILDTSEKSTVQLTVEPCQVSVKKGEDVTLPCQTNVLVPVDGSTVKWSRADLKPPFVHVVNSHEEFALQNSVYRNRTAVSVDRVKDGDVSLTISSVQLSDRGVYTCYITSEMECAVHLIVGQDRPTFVRSRTFTAIIVSVLCLIIFTAFILIALKQPRPPSYSPDHPPDDEERGDVRLPVIPENLPADNPEPRESRESSDPPSPRTPRPVSLPATGHAHNRNKSRNHGNLRRRRNTTSKRSSPGSAPYDTPGKSAVLWVLGVVLICSVVPPIAIIVIGTFWCIGAWKQRPNKEGPEGSTTKKREEPAAISDVEDPGLNSDPADSGVETGESEEDSEPHAPKESSDPPSPPTPRPVSPPATGQVHKRNKARNHGNQQKRRHTTSKRSSPGSAPYDTPAVCV